MEYPEIILSKEQRDELTQIPDDINNWIVSKYYTFSKQELEFCNSHRRESNRLGFAIQLCCIKYPGWTFSSNATIPTSILNYVASQITVSPAVFKYYGERRPTRIRHIEEICKFLGYRMFTNTISVSLEKYIAEEANINDDSLHLVKYSISFLRKCKIILPGISTIEKAVRKVTYDLETSLYSSISVKLNLEQKKELDNILNISEKYGGVTVLSYLKASTGQGSPQALLQVVEKIKLIRKLSLNFDFSHVHPNKFKKLYVAASRYEPHMFRRFYEDKKYALLVIYLQRLSESLVDTAVEINDRLINSYMSRGRKLQDEMQQSNGKSVNEKMLLLINIGNALIKSRNEGSDPFIAIEKVMPWDKIIEYIESAKTIVRPQNYDYLDLVDRWYSQMRKYSPAFLEAFDFSSTNHLTSSLTKGIDTIRTLNRENKRSVPIDSPVDFVNERWGKYIYNEDGSINRHYYEMAALAELRNGIRSGDISVKGSSNYRNFEDYIITKQEWKLKDDIQEKLAISESFEDYIKERTESLTKMYDILSKNIGNLYDVEIKEGKIHLDRLEKDVPDETRQFNDKIYNMLPRIKLTEVMYEVAKWTNFDKYFVHASSGNAPQNNESSLVIAALLAMGTNIGLSKMADSTSDFTYHQIANVAQWRLHDDAMKKAQACLVNYHHRLLLPTYWGDGTTSSSDGMRVQVGVSSLISDHNPHYGSKKGSTMYRFVSDQYSTFFTRIINTNARDAVHVIDGLLEHETDLLIQEHYTDTAGYTDQVFGLSHILGFIFAPRIRDISDSKLYILPGQSLDKNLSNIAAAKINVNAIKENYDTIRRLGYSIKDGFVSSSLIMSKLGSYSRQNAMAKALQEMGRIEKTIFILKYITDKALRRKILKGLNKGEAMNGLARAVFFGKQGELRERDMEDQLQRASSLNIIINCLSIWNTVYLEKALLYLKENEGFDEELLKYISPLNWSHINFYGEYIFDRKMSLDMNEYRPLII